MKYLKMKSLIILLIISSLCGCSVTIVYAPKHVCNSGSDNKTEITGSDLKGNSASQTSDGKLTIPLTP